MRTRTSRHVRSHPISSLPAVEFSYDTLKGNRYCTQERFDVHLYSYICRVGESDVPLYQSSRRFHDIPMIDIPKNWSREISQSDRLQDRNVECVPSGKYCHCFLSQLPKSSMQRQRTLAFWYIYGSPCAPNSDGQELPKSIQGIVYRAVSVESEDSTTSHS